LGKTTCSRILASELNPDLSTQERDSLFDGLPNPVCFHINGGDKRKIDDIRELINIAMSCLQSMYSYNYVFIIDEAHQLTEEAVNALLVPTESPPPNVYFIFTTTDMAKMQRNKETRALLSRCEVYDFHTLSEQDLRLLLDELAVKYKVEPLNQEAFARVVQESRGMPRTAVTLFSMYYRTGQFTTTESPNEQTIASVVKLIVDGVENAATGRKRVSWAMLKAYLSKLMSLVDAEQSRIVLMQRIAASILRADALDTRTAHIYKHAGCILRDPITFPQQSDLIVRFYSIYLDALEIRSNYSKSRGDEESTSNGNGTYGKSIKDETG
jgi:DNA polymerase III delta prime subunit